MSMIASLVRAYERLPDAPPFGFSSEKIGFCIVLNSDGTVAEVIDLRGDDKKRSPRMVLVPQAVKRTVGIAPNFLWDKSAYVLGVTAGDGKRTADEHAKFREAHAEWLSDTDDAGLLALLRFLESWRPEHFVPPIWPEEMRDQNIVFALAEEYRERFLHDRHAARQAWNGIGAAGASAPQICLVTGERTATARLHPSIKGVWGAQSSGASIVSFNLDAFTSYGHEQGDNAPVSEAAVFAYTTALNRFLEKGSGHRIQIGDASTVFWVDAEKHMAELAESFFAAMFDTGEAEDTSKTEDKLQTKILATQLESIRLGQKLTDVLPQIDPGVRFHVLGLSPNAARLSVRFYWEDDFGRLTANYQKYLREMAIEPAPDGWPPLWHYLNDLAVLGKRDNVPPNLAGDWMRSILTGTPYPLTLLTMALTRIRADGKVNALRAAILKSVLIRNLNMEAPVALDPAYKDNKGYVLGRLFAVYEQIQRAALGRNVNATIKDKFYGSASATPQKVFRTLDAGSQNHFSRLRKQNPGWAVNLEKLLASVTDLMDPAGDPIPVSLNSAEQAMFGIGYHHQRSEFFRERDDKNTDPTEADE